MYNADQQRDRFLAPSFLQVDLPATKTAPSSAQLYLMAGDLERAFDRREFRPDAVIVPTNTDLLLTAPAPATQRVLIARVEKQAETMRDLTEQVEMRRKQSAASAGATGILQIGLDTFVARLPRTGKTDDAAPFPASACFVATDFAKGGAIDRRELFAQDRVRKGIGDCLSALDAAGAHSIVLPLMGAASSGTQADDALFEGQRTLMECRLINATAGVALGIHDFAARRRNVREVGVVQWDQELSRMFKVPSGSRAEKAAQAAYRVFAEQVKLAFRKGLAGEKTTRSDVSGSCTAILNASPSR
ncbi:MAG TPA: hypothetical protein VFO31_29415 [Vicinamibacterales bacterium]|nr:hypothetical protein [Vicinamibacterales bacterium]